MAAAISPVNTAGIRYRGWPASSLTAKSEYQMDIASVKWNSSANVTRGRVPRISSDAAATLPASTDTKNTNRNPYSSTLPAVASTGRSGSTPKIPMSADAPQIGGGDVQAANDSVAGVNTRRDTSAYFTSSPATSAAPQTSIRRVGRAAPVHHADPSTPMATGIA